MPVAIRSAGLDDVPAILAIERLAATAAHWSGEQYSTLVDSGVVLLAELVDELAPAPCKERKERGTHGQELGTRGGICGFVCAKAVAGEWEIENIVVGADFLRRGVARELLGELIRRAQRDGASAILLEVRESNRVARRLYEKQGFCEVGRRRAYYRDPVEDAVLYALRFSRES